MLQLAVAAALTARTAQQRGSSPAKTKLPMHGMAAKVLVAAS